MKETTRGTLLCVLFFGLVVGGVPALGESSSGTMSNGLVVVPTTNLCKNKVYRTNAASPPLDECFECERDCFAEWRACRQACNDPDVPDWLECHNECVYDLEWCLGTGCGPLCSRTDSSREGRKTAEDLQSAVGTDTGLRTRETTPEVSSRIPTATW